jgi:hypothetical protein
LYLPAVFFLNKHHHHQQVLQDREDVIANLKNEQRQQELKNEYQLMYSNANQVADNLQHASG